MGTKISVITTVYNNEKLLPRAIESVLNQTFKDYELIIIDDGSTDNTPEIIDEYAANNSKIKAIHQNNQWIFNSLNNGIAIAEGEYSVVLNSDDCLYDNNVLFVLNEYAKKYNPDVVYFAVEMMRYYKDELIGHHTIGFENKEIVFKHFENSDIFKANFLNLMRDKFILNQINLYRTSLMKAHKFRTEYYGSDLLFNFQIANDINSAIIIPEKIYKFSAFIDDNINTSKKYWGYEHKMFNEFYDELSKLLTSWGIFTDENRRYVDGERISDISAEINFLNASNCKLCIDEKLKKAFLESMDALVYKCALETDKVEELESRILSGCRNIMVLNEIPDESSDVYFIYELLDSLLRYEKDEEDIEKIRNAVYHKLNPYHIGESFYKKILNGKKDENV